MNNLQCRACGSDSVSILEKKAMLMPFFVKRVYGCSLSRPSVSVGPKFRLLDKISLGMLGLVIRLISKRIEEVYLKTDASICLKCGFWSTLRPFNEDDLEGLYLDYRSDSYNSERDFFEPGYKLNVAPFIGSESESLIRKKRLNDYLARFKVVSSRRPRLILDWGGADGRFLPDFSWDTEKYSYEISNITPVQNVTRIGQFDSCMKYDYIQVAHVLEHLPHPRKALETVLGRLNANSLLYIELPLEVDPDLSAAQVISGGLDLHVHEHINKFTPRSLEAMLLSLDLVIIDLSVDSYNAGWANVSVMRCLAVPPGGLILTTEAD